MHRTVATGAAAVFVLLAVLLSVPSAAATTIPFTPSPANIGVSFSNTEVDLFSSGLNGTTLAGQPMSLDLVLTNDLLARIQLTTPDALGVTLTVFTNAGTEPGFSGPTTGFLINPAGNPWSAPQDAGRSQASNGTFSMGLTGFSSGQFGGAGTIDISGVHFETSFPNSGFLITNSRLRFTLVTNHLIFGTAQQLPEPSTLVLLFAGISLVGLAYRTKRTF
ncbi:MAG TPA: PEP-CTERM sorting domain-containing protein [Terriglobia bacterium]|nr:PEP-CTERM sorting domain-containing protein [Terriglobia bacterium]